MRKLAITWAATLIALAAVIAGTVTAGLTPITCAAWTIWGVGFGIAATHTYVTWARQQ